MISIKPPVSDATTGLFAAIASKATIPNGSKSEGTTDTSAHFEVESEFVHLEAFEENFMFKSHAADYV